MKLTLIGRPKQVAKAKTCMVAIMEGRPVPDSMPKGLPSPPNAGSSFAVFIATKQWNRVAATLKENKEDELIIEGYPIFDPAKKVTAVLAQGVTTKITQRIGAARKKAGLTDENEAELEAEEIENEVEEAAETEAEDAEEAEAEAVEEAAEAEAEDADDADDTDADDTDMAEADESEAHEADDDGADADEAEDDGDVEAEDEAQAKE